MFFYLSRGYTIERSTHELKIKYYVKVSAAGMTKAYEGKIPSMWIFNRC